MQKRVMEFIRDEDGLTMVEYAIAGSLVGLACVLAGVFVAVPGVRGAVVPDEVGDFGLLQTSDGLVHRVTIGNHIGQNYGRISDISDAQIQLVEIIPDGLGGYLERPAAVGLSD